MEFVSVLRQVTAYEYNYENYNYSLTTESKYYTTTMTGSGAGVTPSRTSSTAHFEYGLANN